jgi:exoribonuclease-2
MLLDPNTIPMDLRAVAYQAVLDAGFAPDIPPNVAREVQAIDERQHAAVGQVTCDLRSLLWSSIDNPESRDLDQVEVAERQKGGDIRVLVAIADVDALVPARSATDRYAAENATSVYTGVATFPMLPEHLSNDLTSLLEGEDRLAMVIELLLGKDGSVQASTVYRAVVRNHAKLDYETVGAWLEGAAAPDKVAAIAGLEQSCVYKTRQPAVCARCAGATVRSIWRRSRSARLWPAERSSI